MGRKKAQSGTWVTRELLRSKAFWALNGTAKGLLFQFLLKRNMNKQYNCLNKRSITMTYLELENLFGKDPFGKPDGLSRSSVNRAIKNLLARGFVEIVHQGGAYQKDKTVYGLTDDWQWWVPGRTIREKEPGKRSSRTQYKKSQPSKVEPYTPPKVKPKTIV